MSAHPNDAPSRTGRLLVAATPLGNPDDLTPRVRRALGTVALVLAEDTRRAGLQFKRWGLSPAGRLLSFYDHNEDARIPQVLEALERGEDVALISDAGTPILSDPGYRLVRACREAGVEVSPLPGPCAPVAALSACGLPPLPFVFLGFLPRKAGDVRRVLEPYAALPATLVFFERKNRLAVTLDIAAEVLGPRQVCLARELTKDHEQFIVFDLPETPLPGELRGELTVVVGPPSQNAVMSAEELRERIRAERKVGGRVKDIAKRVAAGAAGWTAKSVYEEMMAMEQRDRDAP